MRRLFDWTMIILLVLLWSGLFTVITVPQTKPDRPKRCAFEGTPDAWMCPPSGPTQPGPTLPPQTGGSGPHTGGGSVL